MTWRRCTGQDCNSDWATIPSSQRSKILRRRRESVVTTLSIVIAVASACCCGSFVLAADEESTRSSSSNSRLQRLDLAPTAALAEHRRQRRRLSGQQQGQRGHQRLEIPEDWLHPYVNAIYATLQPPATATTSTSTPPHDNATLLEDDDHLPAIQEFHELRHFSRFERVYQQEELRVPWNPPTHDTFQWNDVYYNDGGGDDNETLTLQHNQTRRNHGRRVAFSFSSSSSTSSSSLYGGQFNQYQAVPLSQGYGTHYVNLWVGSPTPQRQSVIVDTGSHFTAFPCTGCHKCGAEHHTDPHFIPEQSNTFHVLQCHECIASATTCDATKVAADQTCHFTQSYTEGSSWEAYQALDMVYCGGQDVLQAANPMDHQMAIPFFFGCLTSETGLFVTQLADGIMGMSAHETTLVKQMYNARKLEHNMFAMCFRRELGTSKRGVTAGSMTLGGISSSLDTSPMVYAKNVQPYGWFTVYVKGIYIAKNGGTSFAFNNNKYHDDGTTSNSTGIPYHDNIIKVPVDIDEVNSGKGVIVDSGTTDTYLNIQAAKSFAKIWKQVTGMEYSHSHVYLTRAQLHRLPTILIQCQAAGVGGGTASAAGAAASVPLTTTSSSTANDDHTAASSSSTASSSSPYYVGQVGDLDPTSPQDLLLAIPATHYMEYSPALKLYTSRLYFTETRGGVLGANAMQGHNVAFDWENGRVGFAQSSCAYDTTNITNENTDSSLENDGYARDCHFSSTPAVLSTKCMETVDVRLCLETDDPTNVALMGTETWTRLVETPGTSDGMSCIETAQRDYQRHSRSSTSSFTAGSGVQDGATISDSLLPSQFACPGEGVCLEYRPCEVPCSQVLDYHKNANKIHNEQALPSSPDHMTPTGRASQSHSTIADEFVATSNGFCGDSYWSACDTSCLQSRIVSAWGRDDYNLESSGNNNACVEVSRQTRSCHIDACGRSDPCRVPFLVHAIFALKGGDTEQWSPRALDLFQRALFLAAHNLDPSQEQSNEQRLLFQPGDVDVMLVRPWQIDPDDVDVAERPDEKATISVSAQGTAAEQSSGGDGIVGIELVVQISIFNSKAHTIPPSNRQPTEDDDDHVDNAPSRPPPLRRMTGIESNTSQGHQQRYLLQEIGDMVRNMTIFQRTRTSPESTCNESDLYLLAKDAVLLATSVFQQSDFVSILIATIEELEAAEAGLTKEDSGASSPFLPVYERARNIRASHLVSAWTVGTQIYDSEINYFGPIALTPYLLFLRVCYEASVLFLIFSVGSLVFQTLTNYVSSSRNSQSTSDSSAAVFFHNPTRRVNGYGGLIPWRLRSLVHISIRMGKQFSSWVVRKTSARHPYYSYQPVGGQEDDLSKDEHFLDDYLKGGPTGSGTGSTSYEDYASDNEGDDSSPTPTGRIKISMIRPSNSYLGGRHSKKEDDTTGIYEIELTSSHSFSDIHSERRNSTTKRRNSLPLPTVSPPISIPNSLSA